MSIKRTGVMATPAERLEARSRAVDVSQTPLIVVHGRHLFDDARESFVQWIDRCAQAHGLPAPSLTADGELSHYGMASDGEFTVWVDDGVPHVQVP